ncbi:response regulator transcription factor [Treponema sp.]|uniref:response regulator transcription factor n=1 Tax=Treponema sp. TaxID=166 RepID=UPI00298DCBDB|nr:response regulator transcription factor [Treponema sp.]MCR5614069.1 response regulator transcription factor [Treponema sp.]
MEYDVTFFVVEDHTLTNRGIRQLLSEHDRYNCIGYAFSKSECLDKLNELSDESRLPDILILDLFLGQDSGLDILREVKKNLSSVKVIVYSMYAKPGIVSLALESSADAFVLKSAPEEELFAAIKAVLSGEHYVQQTLVSPLFTYRTIYDGLTRQEQVVFKKLIERKTRPQIAKELNIVERSVENYLSRIYLKTGCKNHEDLIKKFGE